MVRFLVPFIALALLACDKEDEGKEAEVDPIIAPLLSAKNLGPPPPLVPPSAPSPSARPIASAPHPTSDAGTGIACGAPPLPDCPLSRWMKEHTVVPVLAPDFPEIAEAFRVMATFAPPGKYPYWRSISLDGENAANEYDLEAVHAACRGCHTQYRADYVREMRARPLPE